MSHTITLPTMTNTATDTNRLILNYIPPLVEELHVEQRDETFLVFNPLGPRWAIGDFLTPIFVEFCNGRNTVNAIAEMICEKVSSVEASQVLTVAERLIKSGFFDVGNFSPPPILASVSFNLTKSCNLSCKFCYYDSGPNHKVNPTGNLTSQQWIKLASDIVRINSETKIYIMGGEPTLRKDWSEIVQGIAELGVRLNLVTNGMFITSTSVNMLSRFKKLSVQISIDSLDEKLNDQSRGQGHYLKAFSSAKKLRDAGIRTVICSTVTAENYHLTKEMKIYCESEGFIFKPSVFFASGDKSNIASGDLSLGDRELRELLYEDADPNDILTKELFPGLQRRSCGVGSSVLAINPNGGVSPCNHLTDIKFSLGNVRETPIDEIAWRGRTQFSIVDVENLPANGCAGCEVRYICGGGCKANSFHEFGTLQAPPPDCNFLKRHYKDAIWAHLASELINSKK